MKPYLKPYRLIAAAAAAMFAAGAAIAAPVTYQFGGLLTDIRGSGAGLAYGDRFSAEFTYDDQGTAGMLLEPGRALFSNGQLVVRAAALTLSGTPHSELQVFDNWSNGTAGYSNADGFFVSSYVYDAHGYTLLQFDLWDNYGGHKLDSLALPTQAQLVDLASNGRVFIRRFDAGVETGLSSGYFNGMTPISAVPEPAQALLLALGLAAIAASRSRRGQG